MNHGSITLDYFQTLHKGCNQVKTLKWLSTNSRKYPNLPSLWIFFGRGGGKGGRGELNLTSSNPMEITV